MMFLGKFVLGKFGWGAASLVTPVTLLVTGVGFFSLSLFPEYFAPIAQKYVYICIIIIIVIICTFC